MPKIVQAYVAKKLPFDPFVVERLPLISQLQLIGFHKYKNRWAKRFGKSLGRMIFDFAYYYLKLSGQSGPVQLRWNRTNGDRSRQ